MRRLVLIALPLLVAALGGGIVLANANNKNPKLDYHSEAHADTGLTVPDPTGLLGADLARIGEASSDTATDAQDPSHAHAEAEGLQVLGIAIGPSVACDAQAQSTGGVVKDSESAELLEVDQAPVSARVLPADCDARAVQNNNSHSSARTAVADLEVDGVGSASLLEGEARSQTTSGQAHSWASFTVADLEALGYEVTVLRCAETSFATNQNAGGSSSVTIVSIDGVELALPIECPDDVANATSSYTK